MSKLMLPHNFDEIKHPFLVACEGFSDARFICALLENQGITNCVVGCPSAQGGHGMGQDAIAKYLLSIRGVLSARGTVLRGLLVVIDADDDPDAQFTKVSRMIRDAAFFVPAVPFSFEGDPTRVGVYIIPGEGVRGTLENLLLDAAITSNPNLEGCINTFLGCVGKPKKEPSPNMAVKMKMSALTAATCFDNPWTSASGIWGQTGNPVPIASARFQEISEFLDRFTDET